MEGPEQQSRNQWNGNLLGGLTTEDTEKEAYHTLFNFLDQIISVSSAISVVENLRKKRAFLSTVVRRIQCGRAATKRMEPRGGLTTEDTENTEKEAYHILSNFLDQIISVSSAIRG